MIATEGTGLIAIDKMGSKVLLLDSTTYETTRVLDDFAYVPHELLIVNAKQAFVPLFGDGIYGRNPNPGNVIAVIDLEAGTHSHDIDLGPYLAPHGIQLGSDGMLYVTCENSGAVVIVDAARNLVIGAIETGSINSHRLAISPDGARLFTENEEDATISVIDLPGRRLLEKLRTSSALAGIAVSPDGAWLIVVSDEDPVIFVFDAVTLLPWRKIVLQDVPRSAQIARYSPDGSTLMVTSMHSGTVTLIDSSFSRQTTVSVGKQPMDGAFQCDSLFVACQGDGSVHVIDLRSRQVTGVFAVGKGCETLAFF
jgi:YVTN family beta-propeller protein